MLQITIIGTGLIGTSLGLALRTADPKTSPLAELQVTGYDRDQRSTQTARGRLAIDHVARSLDAAVAQANLVVLATPVQTIRELLAELAPLLPAGVVVTDVASTKAEVCAWAAELLPDTVAFVGGHPMAGRERIGPDAAQADLFAGAIYCLTPDAQVAPHALHLVEALATTVGARPYYLDPHEHDTYVAGISHLPFLLSTLLVEAVSHSPAWREMAALAATGFRDISRLASGDPLMHRDICLTNRAALTRWIDEMIAQLQQVRTTLEAQDAEALLTLFEQARDERDAWLARTPHLRPGEEQLQPTAPLRRRWFKFGQPENTKE